MKSKVQSTSEEGGSQDMSTDTGHSLMKIQKYQLLTNDYLRVLLLEGQCTSYAKEERNKNLHFYKDLKAASDDLKENCQCVYIER